MKKLITVAAMFVMTLGLVASAQARETPESQRIARGVEAAGVPVVKMDMVPAHFGERLRLKTTLPASVVVANFKDRLCNGTVVDGLKVVGMGRLVQKDAWSVTLQDEDSNLTPVVIKDAPEGAAITVGRTHKSPLTR